MWFLGRLHMIKMDPNWTFPLNEMGRFKRGWTFTYPDLLMDVIAYIRWMICKDVRITVRINTNCLAGGVDSTR